MTLAQSKQVLPGAGGIGDVELEKPAVEKRDQRNGSRESAARVQPVIDGIPTLLQCQDANIGILDRQQFQDSLAYDIVFIGELAPPRRIGLAQNSGLIC